MTAQLLWLAFGCLLATMFFSAAEMAFIAANRLRLRHLAEEGHAVAARYLSRSASRSPAVQRDDGRDDRPHRGRVAVTFALLRCWGTWPRWW